MKSSYIINEDGFIIRPMQKSDINNYLFLFRYSNQKISEYRKMYLDIFKYKKEDDSNLFFVVLKDNKIIGEISTNALKDSPCDATVRIVIPKEMRSIQKVKNLFVKLCRNIYLYDDIYILPQLGEGKWPEKVMISKKSRYEH